MKLPFLLLVLITATTVRCGGGGGGSAAVRDVAAPQSTLSFPGPVALTDATELAVSGRSIDSSGVERVDVDGVAASSADNFASWTATLPLALGTSQFTVQATDRRGNREAGATNAVVSRVEQLLIGPQQVAFDPTNRSALVYDFTARTLVSLDLRTEERRLVSDPFRDGGPALDLGRGLAIDPPRRRAWLLRFRPVEDDVVEIDLDDGERTLLTDASHSGPPLLESRDFVAETARQRLLVAIEDPPGVIAVDLVDGGRQHFSSAGDGNGIDPERPRSLALDAVHDRIVMLDINVSEGVALLEFDLRTGKRRLLSGQGRGSGVDFDLTVQRVAVASDGETAFVSQLFPSQILAVDLATGDRSVLSDASAGSGPGFGFLLDVEFDASGQQLLAVDAFLSGLFEVDASTGDRSTIGTGPGVGAGPTLSQCLGMTIDPERQRAFVVIPNAVIAVELATGERTLLVSLAASSISTPEFDAPRDRILVLSRDALFSVDAATGAIDFVSSDSRGTGPLLSRTLDLALDAEQERAWVAQLDAQLRSIVLEIDLETGDRVELSGPDRGAGPVLDRVRGIVFDATAHRLIAVANESLVAIDLASGDRTTLEIDDDPGVPPLSFPRSPVLSADGRLLFVRDRIEDVEGNSDPAIYVFDLVERRRALVTSNFATSRRLGPALSDLVDLAFDSKTGTLRGCDVVGHLVAVDVATGERAIASR